MSVASATVETALGRVRGLEQDGVHAFLGIPYAAPPFCERRLRPPEPHEPWDGVREATVYGPTAPKAQYPPPFDRLLPEPSIPGEECLNLNVWTPDPSASARLPVLVWIHGGGFVNGSNAVPQYAGGAFARDGVVCVSVNYRLGADGFLFLGDGVANCGLLDQLAALEWVQESIAAFGGDPSQVTIAGESAGGMSVFTLLSMPRSQGLFGSAISQSGSPAVVLSADTAERVGRALAGKLEVEPTREALAGVSLERLIAAQEQIGMEFRLGPDPEQYGAGALNHLPFEPTVDGEVVPRVPLEGLTAGEGSEVALLAGWNADEYRLFVVPSGVAAGVEEQALGFLAMRYGLDPARALPVYAEQHPGASPGDLFAAIATDFLFRVPTVWGAEARGTAAAPTFLYEFGWKTDVEQLGACHALEIPFVFDTLGTAGETLAGEDAPAALADEVHGAWVRFVSTGDLGWPPFTPERRTAMRFDNDSTLIDDPAGPVLDLWAIVA